MTPRAPHAMSQLMNEIVEYDNTAQFELEDLDGLGVYHSFTVYADKLDDIEEAVSFISAYEERVDVVVDHDDYLEVRMVNKAPIQWSREPFGLAALIEAQAADRKPAKKAAAKKAPAKKAAKKS